MWYQPYHWRQSQQIGSSCDFSAPIMTKEIAVMLGVQPMQGFCDQVGPYFQRTNPNWPMKSEVLGHPRNCIKSSVSALVGVLVWWGYCWCTREAFSKKTHTELTFPWRFQGVQVRSSAVHQQFPAGPGLVETSASARLKATLSASSAHLEVDDFANSGALAGHNRGSPPIPVATGYNGPWL